MDELKKQCSKCKEWYPATFEYFQRTSNGLDYKVGNLCKPCLNARLKQYRRDDPERIRKYGRRNYRKHRKDWNIRERNRRAQERVNSPENLGSVTLEEWETLKKKHDYRCVCCGLQEPAIKLTWDHIRPLSKGGQHHIDNIQPLCHSCNARKGSKEIDYRK